MWSRAERRRTILLVLEVHFCLKQGAHTRRIEAGKGLAHCGRRSHSEGRHSETGYRNESHPLKILLQSKNAFFQSIYTNQVLSILTVESDRGRRSCVACVCLDCFDFAWKWGSKGLAV